jgi:hypothetical protein
MVTGDPGTKAARAVLMDVLDLLREYGDSVVVAGGWVPSLSPSKGIMPHVGTADVDLILDYRRIPEQAKSTLSDLLLDRGYRPGSDQFKFRRTVNTETGPIDVEVDFLTLEPEGNLPGDYYQTIQGVKALKVRGGDLVFEGPITETLEGELPDGSKTSLIVRMASSVPFLILKSLALFDRRARKDAYDIYYYLKNYPKDLDELAKEFQGFMCHKLVLEGLQRLAMCFSSLNSEGPRFVAEFMETEDAEERELLQRDAYEHVNDLIEKLGLRRDKSGS